MTPKKPKPAYQRDACNHCGLCCIEGICRTGSLVFGEAHAPPCPALIDGGHDYLCGLMVHPQRYAPVMAAINGVNRLREAAKLLIGAGTYCCGRYPDEAKIEQPPRLTRKQHADALKVWGIFKASKAAAERQQAESSAHG
jgi:hypothetical protein